MEQQPWQFYFDHFQTRAARVPDEAFGRAELLYEAAHDAYRTTANEMTGGGWNEEEALVVTRMFGQVVKQWLERGVTDLEVLRADLRRQYEEWQR